MQAFMNAFSPGYFTTMGIPILEGRDFDRRDVKKDAKVCIVNRKFAQHYFGNRSAVGRRIGQGGRPDTEARRRNHRGGRGLLIRRPARRSAAAGILARIGATVQSLSM